MSVFNIKTAALAIVAGVSLGGCAYGPYGGLGVGVGYGNGYDPYYGNGYYGSSYYGGGYPYGYAGYGSPYGYGYGSPYYGWYNDFYYPGTGYYVYDRYRNRHRWTDAQRRYWERRRETATRSGSAAPVTENWTDFRNRPRMSRETPRQQTVEANRIHRDRPVARSQVQVEQQQTRSAERQERRAARAEAREERKDSRGTHRRGRQND